jgi:putative ABC transport system permease protein
MLLLTVKQVFAQRFRLALTLVAVMLGVTFVAGTLVLTDTSQRLFADQFRTATAGVDLTVKAQVAFDSAMGVEVDRDPLPAYLTDRVRRVPGVARAEAVAAGQGLLEVRGRSIVPQGPSMLSSWAPPPFGAFTLRDGVAPTAPDQVVIDAATARDHRIHIGDTVTVNSTRTAALDVVGIAGFGDQDGLPNTTVALVDLPEAQQLLKLGTRVSEVRVVTDPSTPAAQVRRDLADALGGEYAVTSSQDVAAAGADAARAKLGYLRLMLFVLAGAALLIGGYLIANTFAIVVTQRSRELATLRAAGATGRQVFALILGEALLVGVAGAATGVALGVAAATGLRDLVGQFGVPLPEGPVTVLPRSLLTAFTVGVVVTVVSALGPSRRAARVAPIEAMRAAGAVTVTARGRLIAGALSAALAGASTAAVTVGDAAIGLLAVAAVTGVMALSLLGPVVVPPLSRFVGRPLGLSGVTGRLAQESAARSPRRTAATVMALALSLALISFMAVVAGSIKGSIKTTYTEVIDADYVIESARAEMLGGLAPGVYDRVRALPGVAAASRMRFGHWKDGDTTSALSAIDPATIGQVTDLHMTDGRLEDLGGGGVVLADHVAKDRRLQVGDTLPMTFSRTGREDLRIVGLVADDDAQALSTDFLISLGTYSRLFAETMDASVFLKVADGSPTGEARLQRALADYPTADVRDQAAAVDGRTAAIDQILGLVTVLLLFTVLIALLGITNALALSIAERTREIGLLRAVGMTRRQLRWMVRGEAVLVAVLAVTLGVAVGLGFAAAVVSALGRTTPVPLNVPAARLAAVIAVATLAGLLAGMLPARRAARLDVLDAISAQ